MVNQFNKSEGHVMSLATGMVDSSEAWLPEAKKIKTPEGLVFSTMRALNLRPKDGRPIIRALELLGQRPFAAPTAEGWPAFSQVVAVWHCRHRRRFDASPNGGAPMTEPIVLDIFTDYV